jgi:hypothetical protein
MALTEAPSMAAAPMDVRIAVVRRTVVLGVAAAGCGTGAPAGAGTDTGTGTGWRLRLSEIRLTASPRRVTATPPATSNTKWLAEASTTNVVAAG